MLCMACVIRRFAVEGQISCALLGLSKGSRCYHLRYSLQKPRTVNFVTRTMAAAVQTAPSTMVEASQKTLEQDYDELCERLKACASHLLCCHYDLRLLHGFPLLTSHFCGLACSTT